MALQTEYAGCEMSIQLGPHLTFRGQCEAAFRFYKRCLGGTELRLLAYGQTPMAETVPAEWRDKIVHASLTIGDKQLAGADVLPDQYEKPQGFYVLVGAEDPTTAERLFGELATEGSIRMPLQKTFWSPCFGIVVDQFGIPWEINCEPAPA